MSSQKGNTKRTRGQKYQNGTAFKNTLHNTNKRSLAINKIVVDGCCARCTEVIEWKIKYKKYKVLTVPKKCVKCEQRTVKKAYCMVCDGCVEKTKVCAKCGNQVDLLRPVGMSDAEMDKKQAQLEQELKLLPERKRRTFLRHQKSGKLDEEEAGETPSVSGVGDADDSDDLRQSSDSERSATESDSESEDDVKPEPSDTNLSRNTDESCQTEQRHSETDQIQTKLADVGL